MACLVAIEQQSSHGLLGRQTRESFCSGFGFYFGVQHSSLLPMELMRLQCMRYVPVNARV